LVGQSPSRFKIVSAADRTGRTLFQHAPNDASSEPLVVRTPDVTNGPVVHRANLHGRLTT